MIPEIPFRPAGATASGGGDDVVVEKFSVRDAMDWFGIAFDDYAAAEKILKGVHGSPCMLASLDARAANSDDPEHARPGVVFGVTTAEEILAKYRIDPGNPMKAAKAFLEERSSTW